jgi:hypothetical protein
MAGPRFFDQWNSNYADADSADECGFFGDFEYKPSVIDILAGLAEDYAGPVSDKLFLNKSNYLSLINKYELSLWPNLNLIQHVKKNQLHI